MNNYSQMDIQLPKTTKFIIRQKIQKQFDSPTNIFQKCEKKSSTMQFTKPYFIVGDFQFKKKFYDDHSTDRMNKTLDQFKNLQQTAMNTTYCNLTMRIQDGTILSKLSRQKQLSMTRDKRLFDKFQQKKQQQQSIKNHIKKRMSHFGTKNINSTITFQKQQIQVSQNPQLIDLINDNIPEYWKNSLRDNQKRLKRHVKGNTFKNEIAEQMLQTMKGRKKLVNSIPTIKQQYIQTLCSRSKDHKQNRKGFSLMGRKLSANMDETMRDTRNKTTIDVPKLKFEEIHKINYSSTNRWRTFQLV